MKLGAVIIIANLAAWVGLVTVRAPLPNSFFAAKDKWLEPGEFHHRSSDPVLVIAGRPLWSWSQYHGGEVTAVKALEAVNLPALVAVVLWDLFVHGALGIPTYTRSLLTFVCLVVATTIQWHLVVRAITAFLTWRQQNGPNGTM
jgi:hypothetical protein